MTNQLEVVSFTKDITMNGRTLCIYHGNCADGFGAAWAFRKAYQERVNTEEFGRDEVSYFPGVYQTGLPPDLRPDDTVIIVDFSYKLADMERLCASVRSVLHIDHHKSAIEDLKDLCLPNYMKDFSIEHSGAMLTWNHFFTGEPPQLFKHIEDRDLWKFALPNTREIQASLFSYPYDFKVWDGLMMKEATLGDLVIEGQAIERKHFKDIHENLNTSVRWMTIGGVEMPVINCPKEWGSDAANILAENAVNHCAAYYWDSAKGRNFGLRSVGDRDVSAIASLYGGGGHKNSAGFTASPILAMEFEYCDKGPNHTVSDWANFRAMQIISRDTFKVKA